MLERDDRRYTVIWTPAKLTRDFYQEVLDEIRAGGIAALHDYLLNIPLGDFGTGTEPPMTKAKADLIELGKDSTERFWDEWIAGNLRCQPRPQNDRRRLQRLSTLLQSRRRAETGAIKHLHRQHRQAPWRRQMPQAVLMKTSVAPSCRPWSSIRPASTRHADP